MEYKDIGNACLELATQMMWEVDTLKLLGRLNRIFQN
jgi:hypothetical protein